MADKKPMTLSKFEIETRLYNDAGNPFIDMSKIDEILQSHKIYKYAWIVHDKDRRDDGSLKEPHVHIYCSCYNGKQQASYRVSDIAKWFDLQEAQVNKIKSSFEAACSYSVHAFNPEKYQYDISEAHTFNVDIQECIDAQKRKILQKNAKEIFEDAYSKICNGMTLREAYEYMGHEIFTKYYDKITKARDVYIKMAIPDPTWKINIYIDAKDSNGNTGGMGKSQLTMALAKKLAKEWFGMDSDLDKQDSSYYKNFVFTTGKEGSEFQSYEAQPIIIWNEKTAAYLIRKFGRDDMKDIMDDHPTNMELNKKYGSCFMKAYVNIFNGAEDFDKFIDGLAGEYIDKEGHYHKADDKTQQYRRIQFNIHITEEEVQFFINKGYFAETREYESFIQVGAMKLKVANVMKTYGTLEAPSIKDFQDRALVISESSKQKAIGERRPLDEDKGVVDEAWDKNALNLLKIDDENMSTKSVNQLSEFVDAEDCPFEDCEQMRLFE